MVPPSLLLLIHHATVAKGLSQPWSPIVLSTLHKSEEEDQMLFILLLGIGPLILTGLFVNVSLGRICPLLFY